MASRKNFPSQKIRRLKKVLENLEKHKQIQVKENEPQTAKYTSEYKTKYIQPMIEKVTTRIKEWEGHA